MKTRVNLVISLLLASVAVWAQAPQTAAPQRGGRGAPAPQPRIMQFEVQPNSIRPGESVTLLWHVENPSTISIGPGLGAVVQRGSRRLTPAATTTYTITVGPPGNAVATRSVTVTVAGTTPVTVTSDSTATRKPVPRTRDGKPDLTGVYDFRAPAGAGGGAGGARGAAANAPAAAPGSVARTPTLKPGMESFRVVRGPFDVGGTCLPSLPPGSFGSPYQFQIIQNKDVVLIFYEYPGTFRIIPIDGEPHPVDPDPSWMGDSVGHWEGDILVVDTIGYNDKTVVSGHRHTEALHTIERFRRTEEALELEVTIEDPNVFVGPWTETRSFRYMPELKKIGEFICENNRDYSPLFGTPVPESQNPRVGVPR